MSAFAQARSCRRCGADYVAIKGNAKYCSPACREADAYERKGHARMRPPEQRIWGYVDKSGPTGCWLWRGVVDQNGYGVARIGRWGIYRAHRLIWEWTRGPIPEAPPGEERIVMDHICRVRLCVNPDHLRVVTNTANVLAGVGASAINARKTHCKRGHEFTPENIYSRPGERPTRVCRECNRMHDKARRRRERLARAS